MKLPMTLKEAVIKETRKPNINMALVKQCKREIVIAEKALVIAGKKLLKAIRATNNEIEEASDMVRDSFQEIDVDEVAEYYARLAEQVIEMRESGMFEEENEDYEN